jgi:hypothetical protein
MACSRRAVDDDPELARSAVRALAGRARCPARPRAGRTDAGPLRWSRLVGRHSVSHDSRGSERRTVASVRLGLSRAERPHLCHRRGKAGRLFLQPRCRQRAGGHDRAGAVLPAVSSGQDVGRRRAAAGELSQRTDDWCGGVRRELRPDRTRDGIRARDARVLSDRALLPLHEPHPQARDSSSAVATAAGGCPDCREHDGSCLRHCLTRHGSAAALREAARRADLGTEVRSGAG